jgi:hypothetical protein
MPFHFLPYSPVWQLQNRMCMMRQGRLGLNGVQSLEFEVQSSECCVVGRFSLMRSEIENNQNNW